MFTNINGLHGNRDELAIAATKFDIVACYETKVTGRRHVSELLLPGFKATTLLLRGARPNGLGMALFVRSGISVSRQERFECSCCEFMIAKIPGQLFNCYLFVVYRNSSTDDRVFDCLCEAMGSIQSVDHKAGHRRSLSTTFVTAIPRKPRILSSCCPIQLLGSAYTE